MWAMQYITLNAATLHVDSSKLVVSGTSCGAAYASFVAYSPRTWNDAIFTGPGQGELSAQLETSIDVSAVVVFEPVCWLEGTPTETPGFHWPDATNPRERTGEARNVAPFEVLKSDSLSRWIRTNTDPDPMTNTQLQIPTFMASGDGKPGTSFFGRDGSTNGTPSDYDREVSAPNDPSFRFPPPVEASPRLHDIWQSNVMRDDLRLADEDHHREHSRFYLRDRINWDFYPNFEPFMTNGSPVLAPTPALPNVADLLLVDGIYSADDDGDGLLNLSPDGLGVPVASALNFEVAKLAYDWLDDEVSPGVAYRNKGANPDAFRATTLRVGEEYRLTIDFNHPDVDSQYDTALVYGYVADTSAPPYEAQFGGGQWLLCDASDPTGNGVQVQEAGVKDPVTGLVEFTLSIPRDDQILGRPICLVAALADFQPGPPAIPVALTNAVDTVIQPGFIEPRAWVNEVHYNDAEAGTAGEFVELAGPAGTVMTSWDLYVYDSSGNVVNSFAVSDLAGTSPVKIPDQSNGFGTVTLDLSAVGLPDGSAGIAVVDFADAPVLERAPLGFTEPLVAVAYGLGAGNSFVGSNGPAAGVTFLDIGVAESASTEADDSLYRDGLGFYANSFAWQPNQGASGSSTPGSVNPSQTFP